MGKKGGKTVKSPQNEGVKAVVRIDKKYVEAFTTSELMRLAENTVMANVRDMQIRELNARLFEHGDQKLIQKLKELRSQLFILKTTNSDVKEIEKVQNELKKVEQQITKKYPKLMTTINQLRVDKRFFVRDNRNTIKKRVIEMVFDEINNMDIENIFKI